MVQGPDKYKIRARLEETLVEIREEERLALEERDRVLNDHERRLGCLSWLWLLFFLTIILWMTARILGSE